MQINITGHHLSTTDAMKHYTLEKMEKVEHHYEHINSIDIVFNVEHRAHIAEATINIPNNRLHARASAEDMYQAFNELVSKLDKQIRRYNDKITSRKRKGE